MDKVYYNHEMSKKFSNSVRFADIYRTLDGKSIKRILCNFDYMKYKYNMYEDGIINNIVFDINEAIEKCGLSDVQRERLEMWMNGYTEQDIGDKYGVSRWVVSKSIVASCEKISRYLKGFK